MNRRAASWLGSVTFHVATAAGLGAVVAVMPVQIGFKRGRTSIELQASIAAAPPSETKPTPKIEPLPQPAEHQPAALTAVETNVERQPAMPPESTKPLDVAPPEPDPPEKVVAALDRQAPPPTPHEVVEVKLQPPKRAVSEAKPRDVEAPTESAAQAASTAAAGIDIDDLPQPHHLNRQPPYPPDAYARRQQGSVVLHLHVTVVGTVADVRLVRSSGVRTLDVAAIEAARGWRYTPARRGGTSIAMVFETHVNFALGG